MNRSSSSTAIFNWCPSVFQGNLYIGGAEVAREYVNRPDLTAERFIAHPFEPGARLYKTGDLARWRQDGTLDTLGRIDHQVKIRGFRIELGEIEAALKSVPGVREVVAVAREDNPGDKRLVAYLVGAEQSATGVQDLRSALEDRLPDYMVPSAFVWLGHLPLTPNGKVDRKALPAPDAQDRPQEGLVAPRNAIEEQLTAIWREVLHLKEVSVFDNFFHLGGHSLLAIQVTSRIRELFKVDLPLFAVFTAPTVAALSEGLASGLWTGDHTPVLPLQRCPRDVPLQASFVQERLWFLHQLEPQSPAYNVPSALRLRGSLNLPLLERALNQLAARHEPFRTTFRYAEDRLHQVIVPDASLRIAVVDFAAHAAGAREEAAKRWLADEANKPFDLERGPLIRASLARIAETEHLLVVVLHHTISDGWSLAVLFQEWAALYDAGSSNRTPPLAQLAVQYADFAAWQRQSMSGAVLDLELAIGNRPLPGLLRQSICPWTIRVSKTAPAKPAGFRSPYLKR